MSRLGVVLAVWSLFGGWWWWRPPQPPPPPPQPTPASVVSAPLLGFDLYPRYCAMSAEAQIDGASTGFGALRIQLTNWADTDPADVERAIGDGVRLVVLNTGASGDGGYDANTIRYELSDRLGGISGYSYGSLIARHPEVQFVLEIGVEPDNYGPTDPEAARTASITVYHDLVEGADGGVALRQQYPSLRYALDLPARYDAAQTVLQWRAGGPAPGGVRDFYDYISIHEYGWTALGDGGDPAQGRLLPELLADPYTHQILVTEFGIDAPGMSLSDKGAAYHQWAASLPGKVKAVTAFPYCAEGWPNYSLGRDPAAVDAYRGD